LERHRIGPDRDILLWLAAISQIIRTLIIRPGMTVCDLVCGNGFHALPIAKLVLLEYRLEDDTVPIKEDHKMSKEQIEKELSANHFRLTRSYDELPWQHMVFYKKI
jgi:hypothetical protein